MVMLDTFKSLSGYIYLDGALRKATGSDGCDAIDPATEEVNGEVVYTCTAEVDEAVAAAKKAQVQWNRLSGLARSEELHEVARRLRNIVPKMAETLTREMGKPYKESANEAHWTAGAFDYYAEISRHEARRSMVTLTSSPNIPSARLESSCRSTSLTCYLAGKLRRRSARAMQ